MASSRPSGIKAPSKIAKPSSLPLRSSSISASSSSLANADVSFASDSTDILTSNTDDFIIGDRVFVNGTKPGYIQYIGETQFAPGEWAGVVLDEPVGKNDGSVSGVRYFQCETKRGVFARLHRITRLPCANGLTPTISQYGDRTVVTSTRVSSTPVSPAGSTKSAKTSPRGGGMSPTVMMATTTMTSVTGGLRVGDRVLVNATSGVKMGWLRYLGPTEFATGNWAGVELDEPIGKNDGSVAGRRYFECRMKYGLFAPLHKVSKMPSGRNSVTTTTTRVTTPVQQSGSLQRGRSGSHESLNSSLSSASSLARAGRVRLGVKALATNTQKPSRPLTSSSSAAHSALQDALKEKEEHIEQLLKERDMERSEVARAAAQVEETEQRLALVHADKIKLYDEIKSTQAVMQDQLESMELEKTEASLMLEDEKKKVEDLQFRLEEETIMRSELEVQTQEDQKRIADLEQQLEREQLKSTSLVQDSDKASEVATLLSTYKDNVDSLKNKIDLLEQTVRAMESKEAESKNKVSTLETQLLRKEESNLQLESSLESRKTELANLQQRIAEMEEELKSSKDKQEKQLQVIDGLNVRIAKSESCSSDLNEELQTFKLSSSDLERQTKAHEERCEQLVQQKNKLEQQVADIMRSSGDNSQQLTQLNDELRQKEKLLDEVQVQVRAVTQELERHKDLLELAQKNTGEESARLTQQHHLEIEEKSKEVSEARKRLEELETRVREQDLALKTRAAEWEDTQRKLHKEEAEGTMLRAQLQEAQLKTEGLNQSVVQGSRLAEEERQQLKIQNDLLQQEVNRVKNQHTAAEDSLGRLRGECESLRKESEVLRQEGEVLRQKSESLRQESEALRAERAAQEAAIREREVQVATLQSETQRLKQEFSQHKEDLQKKLGESKMDSQAIQELHQQLNLQQDTMKKFQALVEELEAEKTKVCNEMSEMRTNYEGKLKAHKESTEKWERESEEAIQRQKSLVTKLEKENAALRKELEDVRVKSQEDLQSLEQKMQTNIEWDSTRRQSELGDIRAQCQKLEDDKKQLENKVVQLQVTLAKTSNQNESDTESKKLREEKEALEGQIEFLNSVIVDMQRKNDELNAKLTNLESDTDLLDTTDLNLNGIKTVRPPRLFCDICDRFDLHDTEDCPTQCAEEEEMQRHSHHGAKRNEERPYCDSCEMFGHWTKDCDDGETF